MTALLQYVATGLTTGATYALVGLGIALIVQVTGVISFAQGEFVMLGGLTFALLEESGMPAVGAAAVAVAIAVVLGAALERFVLPRAKAGRTDQTIMLTIGASIVIEGLTLVFIGTEPHFARPFSAGDALRVGGVSIARQYLWVIGVTTVVLVVLWLVLTRTRVGWAMRATSMDADAARLSGISPNRMSLIVFVVAAALGAIGGIVLAPLQSPDASIGIPLGLKGFAAAVIGGLDRPAGAVVGGLALGIVERIAAGYLPDGYSGYSHAIAFALLLLALLVRPTGLLTAIRAERV
ncbi:MAG: branched-chain amino acid ABC transporter permease [Actinocatenispora sp.]